MVTERRIRKFNTANDAVQFVLRQCSCDRWTIKSVTNARGHTSVSVYYLADVEEE